MARRRPGYPCGLASALALALYAVLLVGAAVAVWRRPVLALYAFLIGLAAYNVTMALLYGAGVRGDAIEAIQTWKEILLAVAAARVALDAWRERRLPFRPRTVDWLALAFAALVVVYAVLPQGALDGRADLKGVVYGLRHDLTPVLAYFVGRSLPLGRRELRRLGLALVGTAVAVAAFGLIDLYAFPIEWWRDSGAVGFFRHQGYDYHGPGRLPENFVFNSSAGVFRRLTSLFLSPLGTAYLLAIALLAIAAAPLLRRRPRVFVPVAALLAAALLLTLSRSTIAALAGAFVVLAIVLRRPWPLAAAAVTALALVGLNSAFPHVAPHTHYFKSDLQYQQEHARQSGPLPQGNGLFNTSEPSFRSHLHLLRVGLTTVVHHPQGYGLGNAGVTALRFGAPVKAGESTYTELGVETGLLGMLAFLAWCLALLVGLARAARCEDGVRPAPAAVAAAFALVLALAIQTDVLGVLWLAFGLWWLAGALLEPAPAAVLAHDRAPSPAAAGDPLPHGMIAR